MKNTPKEIAGQLKVIADNIEKGYLTNANIKVKKEDDGSYDILGDYSVENPESLAKKLTMFYPC